MSVAVRMINTRLVFFKKMTSNDFHENDYWFLWFKMVVFDVSTWDMVSSVEIVPSFEFGVNSTATYIQTCTEPTKVHDEVNQTTRFKFLTRLNWLNFSHCENFTALTFRKF